MYLKMKKNVPLLDLHSINLLTACFLKTKQKNRTLAPLIFLYSIYLFYFYYTINKKQTKKGL